jgi:hypothetical protein
MDGAVSMRDDGEITSGASVDRPLRALDLDQAARLLGVTPERLLAWEARYGFPTSSASERRYNESEVLALRDCLRDAPSIASAAARAREKIGRRRDGGLAS